MSVLESTLIRMFGQTFVMNDGGGAALFPQVGSEVTLSYKEEGGQKVITRIGEKQQ